MIDNHMMVLDDTIKMIEEKLKIDSDPFLESMLERLKIIKANSISNMYEKAKHDNEFKKSRRIAGSFRGYGIS